MGALSHPYRQSPARAKAPRRRVSLSTKLHVLFGRSDALFGLVWALIFVVGGVLASGRIAPRSGPTYDREAVGQVIAVEKVGAQRKDATHEIVATFTDEAGVARTVRSYREGALEVGRTVDVRYQHDHPERAVIEGHRTHEYDLWYPIVMAAFGLFGALTIFWPSKNARLALRLLPAGTITSGKVIDCTERGSGKYRRWTARLAFSTVDKRAAACELATDSEPPYRLGTTWPVVYDPGWPDHATPLAHLGGAPTVTDDGRIAHQQKSWMVPVIAAAVVANAALLVICAALTIGAWL